MESLQVSSHRLAFKLTMTELSWRDRCQASISFSTLRKTMVYSFSCRIIDISSVDEIATRWNKRVFNKRDSKESRLRAEPNARRAIQRLQYYKLHLFKNSGDNTSSDSAGGGGGRIHAGQGRGQSHNQQQQAMWWSQIYNPVFSY